jgi:hypothetical protein
MTASALFVGALGSPGPFVGLALQVLAGALLGRGAVNWMWKANAIGGIHGRPVGVGFGYVVFGRSPVARPS